jgi:opacity protein-like surface antigen
MVGWARLNDFKIALIPLFIVAIVGGCSASSAEEQIPTNQGFIGSYGSAGIKLNRTKHRFKNSTSGLIGSNHFSAIGETDVTQQFTMGTIGLGWQWPIGDQFVFGLGIGLDGELNSNPINIDGSTLSGGTTESRSVSFSANNAWQGSLSTRFGFAPFPRFMIFTELGLDGTGTALQTNITKNGQLRDDQNRVITLSPSFGFGTEVLLRPHLSLLTKFGIQKSARAFSDISDDGFEITSRSSRRINLLYFPAEAFETKANLIRV